MLRNICRTPGQRLTLTAAASARWVHLSSNRAATAACGTDGKSAATDKQQPLRPRANALTDEIIRVDHAGELGADRIYAGQMAILGNGPMGKTIEHMWEQEKDHRKRFENLIQQHRVRPTIMTPIWNVAGFMLGAGTALMGEKAAMACTVAVETVIVEHYNDQLRQIMESPNPDKELLETITKFRDEEQEHHDTGIECGAEQAPFYKAMTEVIKIGCKTAIAISKKI
ncbi:5-demethoxyubiquinone hydroxylase, mitochondrial [Scaptodrosophila lebanonensis]|uniref:5-demethoxyubiquinone hydroxylase, mitochondrial n=1 Tax=Drosophila lebanonensis TaxID=7225 RepID=A0A6J2TZ01_DROLE|nr:5-demethoxyubiquinone hydroxylase, mitochondrial [Scaptodrosophila lebanonensis]XP_030380876.1 5-demethoxyubiquinone hydroxylase, mitochondrial [Scaptodrosophila lebanonensis]